MKKDQGIAVLLIVVSLASLGGLVYPTVSVTSTSTYFTTIPESSVTEFSSSLNILTSPACVGGSGCSAVLAFASTCNPLDPSSGVICFIYRQQTYLSTTIETQFYSITHVHPAQTKPLFLTSKFNVGYISATGTHGLAALLLLVALLLVGVIWLVRVRNKAVKIQ